MSRNHIDEFSLGRKIVPALISVFICAIGTTSTLLGFFLPSSRAQFVLMCALLGSEITMLLLIARVNKKALYFLPFFLYMILLPLLTISSNSWKIQTTMFYIASIFLCFLTIHRLDWVSLILKLMLFMNVFYALATIAACISPSLYLNHMINFFPEDRSRLIDMYKGGGIAGMTSHYSINGNFLAIGLLISVARYKEDRTRLNVGLIALFVVSLLLTGKRGQPIFCLATIVFLYYVTISVNDKNAVKRFFKIMGFAATALIIAWVLVKFVPAFSTLVQRFESSSDSGDISSGRFDLWKIAFNVFRSSPVLGIGWEMFRPEYSWMFSREREYEVHNTYLQLLCESGIIGFVIYMIWFVLLFLITLKQFKKVVQLGVTSKNAIRNLSFSLGFQTFFLIYCITGNPLYDRYMFFPYFLCCGISLYYHFHQDINIYELLSSKIKKKGTF